MLLEDLTQLGKALPVGASVARDMSNAPSLQQQAMAQAVLFLHRGIAGPALKNGPTPTVTAQVILGVHPRTLAPELTRKEASAWVAQSKHSTASSWLWSQVVAEHPEELKDTSRPDDTQVIRWVQEIMRDPPRRASATRSRVAFGGDIEGSVLERLDEILPSDLKRSPTDTLLAADNRIAKEEWDGPDELIKDEPWMSTLPEGSRVIRTFKALRQEGIVMRHCVASYADKVHSKESLIFSLMSTDSRSTLEIRGNQIREHKGPRNEAPSEACVKLAQKVLRYVVSR